jgi:hypothetical protein
MLPAERISEQATHPDERHAVDEDISRVSVKAPHLGISMIQVNTV